MIRVECEIATTINPRYVEKAEWPTELAVRPLKGDCIESKDGGSILQVLSVTHATIRVITVGSIDSIYEDVPGLKLYLGR